MPLFGKGRKGPDQPTTPPILEDVPAQDFIIKLSYSAKSSESVRIKTSPSAVARLARMLDGYSQGEPELVEPYPLEFTQAAPFIARMPAAAEWLTYHRKRLPMTACSFGDSFVAPRSTPLQPARTASTMNSGFPSVSA